MRALMRLVEVLEKKLQKEIQLNGIGYETISLMRDEIDDEMVPLRIILKLTRTSCL